MEECESRAPFSPLDPYNVKMQAEMDDAFYSVLGGRPEGQIFLASLKMAK